VKVLIDHNISPHIARALAAMAAPYGHTVKAKSDLFDTTASVPDTEWFGGLGREGGWAFISDDHGIYKNPQLRAAMLQARLIGFFLEPAWRKPNVSEFERAARLILWLPKLMQQCSAIAPPADYKVPIRHGSRLRPVPLPRR
jgi:hypothetical protein